MLHILQSLLFIYFFLEPFLRISASGFVNFWFVPHDALAETNNRYNLIISILAVPTFIITLGLGHSDRVGYRIILFLPMLRVFCAISRIRLLFLAIIRILYKVYWLSIFGFLIAYIYAIAGIFLYSGAFQDFTVYNKTYSLINFNSFADALWTLYVCFLSSIISHVFLASIDTGEVFYSVLFYLSFLIFFRLVFMKILVAILCDAYRRIHFIIDRSKEGTISSFEFWRYMKDEGRIAQGRWVTATVCTSANGTSSFEINFLEREGTFRAQEAQEEKALSCSCISAQAQSILDCTSQLALITKEELSDRSEEVMECIRILQANAKLLCRKLPQNN